MTEVENAFNTYTLNFTKAKTLNKKIAILWLKRLNFA